MNYFNKIWKEGNWRSSFWRPNFTYVYLWDFRTFRSFWTFSPFGTFRVWWEGPWVKNLEQVDSCCFFNDGSPGWRLGWAGGHCHWWEVEGQGLPHPPTLLPHPERELPLRQKKINQTFQSSSNQMSIVLNYHCHNYHKNAIATLTAQNS